MQQCPGEEDLAVFLGYRVPGRGSGLPFEQDECTEPDRDEVREDDPRGHT